MLSFSNIDKGKLLSTLIFLRLSSSISILPTLQWNTTLRISFALNIAPTILKKLLLCIFILHGEEIFVHLFLTVLVDENLENISSLRPVENPSRTLRYFLKSFGKHRRIELLDLLMNWSKHWNGAVF